MTLNQIAKQAMDYLDSVGVAADYDIKDGILTVKTDTKSFTHEACSPADCVLIGIGFVYPPQKSPA